MLLGASIAVSIGVASIAVMWAMGGTKLLIMLVQRMWMGGTSFPLLAVPFFILAGNLMNRGGVTIRIFNVARVLVGGIRGGLAHMTAMEATPMLTAMEAPSSINATMARSTTTENILRLPLLPARQTSRCRPCGKAGSHETRLPLARGLHVAEELAPGLVTDPFLQLGV
ncbi:MAG TPA: TRAP transporter large permease subunit, partial [Candidatus Methylomirabilis sp.]|nr:TRAP transporter large permease subunit [Candidatus Methylomirabilis sp.]